jgi:hypothetical protein
MLHLEALAVVWIGVPGLRALKDLVRPLRCLRFRWDGGDAWHGGGGVEGGVGRIGGGWCDDATSAALVLIYNIKAVLVRGSKSCTDSGSRSGAASETIGQDGGEGGEGQDMKGSQRGSRHQGTSGQDIKGPRHPMHPSPADGGGVGEGGGHVQVSLTLPPASLCSYLQRALGWGAQVRGGRGGGDREDVLEMCGAMLQRHAQRLETLDVRHASAVVAAALAARLVVGVPSAPFSLPPTSPPHLSPSTPTHPASYFSDPPLEISFHRITPPPPRLHASGQRDTLVQ